MSDKRHKIIIDCDPGVDDAYAIAIALKSKELDVLAIHTVAGNVSVEHTTRNARGLVYLLKSDIRICKGSAMPLCGKQVIAADIHGNNGLAGHEFRDDELAPLSVMSALESYYEILSCSKEPIDIVAVGPLTNVAALLIAYPHLKEKIGIISIMGGGIRNGNITPAAEFNFYADPEAAQIVFQSGIKLIMSGLDVTEQAVIFEEDANQIADECGDIGALLHKIVQPTFKRTREKLGIASSQPNDVCAIFALIESDMFEGKELRVDIETAGQLTRGMSIADQRSMNAEPGNCLVLFNVDKERFRKTICQRLSQYSNQK